VAIGVLHVNCVVIIAFSSCATAVCQQSGEHHAHHLLDLVDLYAVAARAAGFVGFTSKLSLIAHVDVASLLLLLLFCCAGTPQ
jgi:hypothetical protein